MFRTTFRSVRISDLYQEHAILVKMGYGNGDRKKKIGLASVAILRGAHNPSSDLFYALAQHIHTHTHP